MCRSGTQQQQHINQLVAQQQADRQQQAAEILLLKRKDDRLRNDVGTRNSHQDQAAYPQRANTQLAALDQDVKQLQRQQPKPTQQDVVERATAMPGQEAPAHGRLDQVPHQRC